MTELWEHGMAGLRRIISDREVSPVEVVESSLARIAALDPELRCFARVLPEKARAAAKAAEEAMTRGEPLGPLHGVPIVVKDIVDVEGEPTGNGSRISEGHIAAADSAVAARLTQAGAILIGKTETHEFAIGGPDEALPFGPARNPWNPLHYPGGSSSGSGAAVASGIIPGAIGTDTGGSIRIPAAYCGLAGMKPTYGRVSRRGVSPLAYSLDHVGPMTWTVEDNALMLEAIAGYDPLDPASADRPTDPYAATVRDGVGGLRVGLARGFHDKDVSDEATGAFDAAADALAQAGARISDVSLSALAEYVACNRVILLSEGYAVHERDLQERPELFGPYMRTRLLPGALFTASDYVQALRRRRELCAEMADAMRDLDLLVVVGAVGAAPELAAVPPDTLYAGPPSVTSPFNVTGLPALSVCVGHSASGLPLAVQLVAKPFAEAVAYRAGQVLEDRLGDRARRPALAYTAALAA